MSSTGYGTSVDHARDHQGAGRDAGPGRHRPVDGDPRASSPDDGRGRRGVTVLVRLDPDLRWLLAPRFRAAGERPLGSAPDATVAHLVQAAGVPLTEAGGVRVDGEPVPLSARTRPGAVLEVDPAPRPQPAPAGGFLPDV